MSAARILVDADVRVMDAADTRARAVAWRDGRLLAVGTPGEVARVAGPDAERLDAGGATVLPGFIDAHHHVSIAALYGGLVRLVPPEVTDVASLQRALRRAAEGLPPGRWLVAYDWDELRLSERRPPTRRELDDAVGDRPLFALHYSGHRALASSRALELGGIGRASADPAGGSFVRGPGGEPSGLLLERGMSPVEALARRSVIAHDAEGFFARVAQHHARMLAAGITRVVDATVPGDVASLYREAARRGLLTVPTVMLPVSTAGYLEEPWEVLDGPPPGAGDGVLTVGPVKLVFDGAPACAMCLGWWQTAGTVVRSWALALRQGSLDPLRTAMSLEPRLGRAIRTGIAIYRQADARRVVGAAVERGFGLATHAIGNDAVDVAVSAYEAAGARLHDAGVPRLEHAAFLSRELVARIAGLGAAVVTQPAFFGLPAYAAAASIPGVRNAPLRWLLDAGVRVAGSSDHPVAGFEPLDAIRAALTRRTARGHEYEPDQRITLREALVLYTRAAAEVSGAGALCGTLEAGKRADLVVLSGTLEGEAQLEGLGVRATVVGGELGYGALPPCPP